MKKKRIVVKFGGTSVKDVGRLLKVAEYIANLKQQEYDVIVVLSAMGDTTDRLVETAYQITPNPDKREMDMLMAAGEQISVSLMATTLLSMGIPAISYLAGQIGFLTTKEHGSARIRTISNKERIETDLSEGKVVIFAGFQGIDEEKKDITTLGRGGSDTTAVALAVAFNADVCEILTDVDGVYPVDPRIVEGVRRLEEIDYGLMIVSSMAGSGVVHHRAVKIAERYGLEIVTKLSISVGESEGGTVIRNRRDMQNLETLIYPTLIAVKNNLSIITVSGIEDKPGKSAEISKIFAEEDISFEEKGQGASTVDGKASQDFLLGTKLSQLILPVLREKREDLSNTLSDDWAKITVVDPIKAEDSGFCYRIESAVGRVNVSMRMQGGSEQSFWILVPEVDKIKTVQALAEEFDLVA